MKWNKADVSKLNQQFNSITAQQLILTQIYRIPNSDQYHITLRPENMMTALNFRVTINHQSINISDIRKGQITSFYSEHVAGWCGKTRDMVMYLELQEC